MVAAMQGGANAKRCEFLCKNGHKGSDLVWIMQAKSKISKKKDESNEPLRLKQYKQRAKVMHWYGLYTYINSPRKPLMVNTANE